VELGRLQPGEWRELSWQEVAEGTEFTTKKRRERRRTKKRSL